MSNILNLDQVSYLGREIGTQGATIDILVLMGSDWWHITITYYMFLDIFVMDILSKCRENNRMNVHHPSLITYHSASTVNSILLFLLHLPYFYFSEMFSCKLQTSCYFTFISVFISSRKWPFKKYNHPTLRICNKINNNCIILSNIYFTCKFLQLSERCLFIYLVCMDGGQSKACKKFLLVIILNKTF